MMTDISQKPQITDNGLEFGNYCVPMSEVVKFTDNTVITRRHDLYFVWKYNTRFSNTLQWHCNEISPSWLTIIYSPLT